jgi:Transposase C of IS166 homeodomain
MTTATVPLEQHLAEVSRWKETYESLDKEVGYLKEQLEWFKKQLFGKKAEKFVDTRNEEQLCFEGYDKLATVAPEKKIIPAHERTKRRPTGEDKIILPADLPIECQVIDLPEEAKVCSETGIPLVKIGEEVTSKLAHRPGSYFIK